MTDRPSAQREPIDPDLLARWLAISGLQASAQDMLVPRGGAWTGLALVSADTATEAILGLLTAGADKQPDEHDTFEQVLALAIEAVRQGGGDIGPSLRTRIREVHRQRNLAVHIGADVSIRTAERALRVSRDLRQLAIERSPLLTVLGRAGPIRAVGELVGVQVIEQALADAEDALRSERPEAAADAAAVGLTDALRRLAPSVRPRSRMPMAIPGVRPDENIRVLSERADRLEAWIVATAVGLRPSELTRLTRTLGRVFWFSDGVRVERQEDVQLTLATTEAAVIQTADVIFRLWATESLQLDEFVL